MDNNRLFNKKTAGALVFILLLLSVFFSSTVFNYRLPVATADVPKNGKLSKSETVSGIVDWTDSLSIYSPLGGTVAEILAREGETLVKGEPILRMNYDIDDLNQRIAENGLSRRKLEVEIENIQLKMQKTQRNISELKSEVYKADTVSTFDLEQLESDIAKAEEAYAQLAALYAAGAITQQELDNSAHNLASQRAKRDDMIKTNTEKEEKNAETVADQEKSRQKQLNDYQYDLEMLQQDSKTKALELENLSLQKKAYEKALADYDQYGIITAPQDGTLLTLPVKQGQYINDNFLIVEMGLGDSFQIECDVALSNNYITVGDACKISNTSYSFDAAVTKITPTENAKRITVSFSSDKVSAGETFDVKFSKESTTSYTLVPNGAVNMDGDGYYLYQIKRRDGLLGKEFYAVKQRVYIGDSDSSYTVITQGVTFFEPIVLYADKYFAENETIKLSNESDFFEN